MARDVKRIRKAFTADQRSRLEITEKSDRGMESNVDENEEVSKYYKADRASKLIERLTAGTQLSADNGIIRELADYMKANAGICNFWYLWDTVAQSPKANYSDMLDCVASGISNMLLMRLWCDSVQLCVNHDL